MLLIAKSFILNKSKGDRVREVSTEVHLKGDSGGGKDHCRWRESGAWRLRGLPPHSGLAEQGGCA